MTASFLSLSMSLFRLRYPDFNETQVVCGRLRLRVLVLICVDSFSGFFCSRVWSASRFVASFSLSTLICSSQKTNTYKQQTHTNNKKRERERRDIQSRHKKRKKSRDDENDENSREIFVSSGDALQLHLLVFLSSLVLFVENAASSRSDEQSGSV